MYWNEYRTKSENKNTTNEYRYFLESNCVGVNRLVVLIYSDQDNNSKRCKTKRYYLPNGAIKSYNVIINGKNFYDQLIDSDIKNSKEISRMFVRFWEHQRSLQINSSWFEYTKKIDANPKEIQRMERKETKHLSRKCNSVIKNGKLSRSKS